MKKYLLIACLFIIFKTVGFSQTDTVFIIKSDTVFMTEKHDQMYKSFVERRDIETKHLWKINLVDMGLLCPNIGYEQRIGKKWSTEAYACYGMTTIYKSSSQDLKTASYTKIEFEQQFKYYFNIKHREKLGKKTNGFSADYISSSFLFNDYSDPSLKTDTTHIPNVQDINIGINYGIQRRIGNLGYIECYVGLYYRWETVSQMTVSSSFETEQWKEYYNDIVPIIGIKAGFAIASFDNIRRILKD